MYILNIVLINPHAHSSLIIRILSYIIGKTSPKLALFANDIQLFTFFPINSHNTINSELIECANCIILWLFSNKLLINSPNTTLLNIGEINQIRTVPEYVYSRYLRNHKSYKNLFNE